MNDKQIIGIDLGGTSTKIGLVNTSGEVLDKWEFSTDTTGDGGNIVPNIIKSINNYLEGNHISSENILGIGMGSPGNINRIDGTVIGAYNLGWTTLQNVKERVQEQTNIPFFIDNDANVAALGEQWKGAGNNEENVVFITLGTGVGGGIIVDGKLLHGAANSAGEIGHLAVAEGEYSYQCTCGKKGCLETVASATGVRNIAFDMMNKFEGESALRLFYDKHGYLNSKIIFDAAKDNDKLALMAVNKVCEFLSKASGNLANILNPSTIVLGGGVSKAGEYLADKVRSGFSDYAFPQIKDKTKIKIAELENDAGIIGASSLVLSETK